MNRNSQITTNNTSVSFVNVPTGRVRRRFIQVLNRYKPLHPHPMTLRSTPLSYSSMRAQPIVNRDYWFPNRRHYRVDMSIVSQIHDDIKVADMPDDVLDGWFAHELGHIMDYRLRSGWNLMQFGLRYLISDEYRLDAERQADRFAVRYGYGEELIATKRFILDHADVSERYKQRIEKYYLGPDEIEQLVTDHSRMQP